MLNTTEEYDKGEIEAEIAIPISRQRRSEELQFF